MKGTIIAVIIAVALVGTGFAAEKAPPLKDKRDKVSYTVGADVGMLLKKQSVDVNLEVLMQAIKDALAGAPLRLSEKEMADIRSEVGKEVTAGREKEKIAIAEKNRKEEERFFAENKTKEGVVTLASGLQYKVLKAGSGKTPKENDLVTVHYRVTLLSGKEIESSYGKPEPDTFDLENVVPGWREGARLMQPGAKWRLFVPSKLAYGEDGVGELLEPNSTLIFDIELFKITEKPPETEEADAGEKPEAKEKGEVK